MNNSAQVNASIQGKRKGGGCFLYGCLIAVVIAMIVGGLIFFFAYRSLSHAVESYTSASPTPVPVIQIDATTSSAAESKYQQLLTALKGGAGDVDLSFTPNELNSLLYSSAPDLPLQKMIAFGSEGKEVTARFSVKVSDLKQMWSALDRFTSGMEERYANGFAKASIAINNGAFSVRFSSINLNGNALPDMALGMANGWFEGLAKSIKGEGSDEVNQMLARIHSITTDGGVIKISAGDGGAAQAHPLALPTPTP